jgi:hypothetical protein
VGLSGPRSQPSPYQTSPLPSRCRIVAAGTSRNEASVFVTHVAADYSRFREGRVSEAVWVQTYVLGTTFWTEQVRVVLSLAPATVSEHCRGHLPSGPVCVMRPSAESWYDTIDLPDVRARACLTHVDGHVALRRAKRLCPLPVWWAM